MESLNNKMIGTYRELFRQLDSVEINYCSWKNNHLLEQSLLAHRDIDLLVDINKLSEFETLLRRFYFVEFLQPRDGNRSIRHYYKYDAVGQIFLHLHVYFRVITGESLFKNYQLPFEQSILENSFVNSHNIKEANPEHQMQLYAIRKLIKCSSVPSVLVYLRDFSDYSVEKTYITQLTGSGVMSPNSDIGSEWIQKIESGIVQNSISGLVLRNRFKGYRLKTGIAAFLGSYSGFLELVLRRLFRKKGKRCTGLIISVIGIDGSGKTSAVDDLVTHFGKVLSTRKLHFGRPPFALLTFPAWLALRFYKMVKVSDAKTGVNIHQKDTSFLQAVRLVSLAYDRFNVMSLACKLRGKGYLVIMDRCPVETVGCMDAPKIIYSGSSSAMHFLLRLERGYYLEMAKVDHGIYMKTSVETAIARNNARSKAGKETDEEIRDRYRQNIDAKFNAARIHLINTEKELSQVREEIRLLVWNLLVSSN